MGTDRAQAWANQLERVHNWTKKDQNIFKELGQSQKAIDYFKKAIEINSNYAEAYNSLGMDDLAEQAESIFLANQTKDPNQTIVLEESEPWYKFW